MLDQNLPRKNNDSVSIGGPKVAFKACKQNGILATDLHCRCVDIKLPEDGKSLLKELVADGNVGDVRGIVVVQAVDVLHDASAIGFNGRQDQKVLQVPKQQQRWLKYLL